MRLLTRARARRLGLAWLIGLALLVPLAQAAATWHVFSHLDANASQRGDDPSSPRTDVCDLCVAAAAVGDGGPAPAVHALVLLGFTETLAPATVVARWLSPASAGYSSRAPPLSLR